MREYGFLASNLEKGFKKEIAFVKYIKRFEVQKDTTPNSGELNLGISTLTFSIHRILKDLAVYTGYNRGLTWYSNQLYNRLSLKK